MGGALPALMALRPSNRRRDLRGIQGKALHDLRSKSKRMLPGSSGGRPMLCRALAPTSSPGWAGASRPCPDPLLFLGRWRCAPFCALRVRRSPRCAWLRPLRRAAPAPPSAPRSVAWLPRALVGPSPGPGRPCVPPLSRSARVRACALRGRSLPPSAFGPGLAALRASCSVALAPSRPWALCSASARGGSSAGPLRGFGPGGSPRGPPARCARLFPLSGGPAFGCARPPAAACRGVLRPAGRAWPPCRAFVAPAAAARFRAFCGFLWRCAVRRVLPCFPPAPAAPAGGSRGARGLRPECRFSRPSRGCAASRGRPPVRPLRRGSQSENCKPGIDFPVRACYS